MYRYTIENDRVPGVTDILPKIDFYCTPEQLEAARQDGNDLHSMIKLYCDTNETYGDQIIEKFSDHIKAHQSLFGNLIMWEEVLYSKKHRFAGKPDLLFTESIIDVKRSLLNPRYHALQLAGYELLKIENKIAPKTKKHFILYFLNDSWHHKNVWNDQAENAFLILLSMHRMQRNIDSYFKAV